MKDGSIFSRGSRILAVDTLLLTLRHRGADEASLQIHEASLTVSLANSDPVNAMPPLPGTRLAAYYNPDLDQRFIIYQLKNAPFKLFEWNIDKKDGKSLLLPSDMNHLLDPKQSTERILCVLSIF